MIESVKDSFLWAEKYRPKKLIDCVLPSAMKTELQAFIDSEQVPHCLFSGKAGCGKSTAARAIAEQIGADIMTINLSNETGIDVVRNKIVQFASTASFEGNLKVIIGEEFGNMSNAASDSLKGIIEEFHKTTRFIFTTNNLHKVSEPIRSRCTAFEFKISEEEKKTLMMQMIKRCAEILKAEGIEYDNKPLLAIVQKNFPDFRKTLNELQKFSTYGSIQAANLVEAKTGFDDLIEMMKGKKLGDMITWNAKNSDLDPQTLIDYFYDNAKILFTGKTIADIYLMLGQSQFELAHIVNKPLHSITVMINITSIAEWK